MKEFIKDNWFKLCFAVSVVLIGFSVFYYFVIFIPEKERMKAEQAKQEQVDKELKEQKDKEESESALNNCISNAEKKYSDMWHKECKTQGKLTNECIDINELSFDEYLKKYGLTTDDYIEQRNLTPSDTNNLISARFSATIDYIKRSEDECSCRLLTSTADRFDEILEKDKAECFTRYSQK